MLEKPKPEEQLTVPCQEELQRLICEARMMEYKRSAKGLAWLGVIVFATKGLIVLYDFFSRFL
ncbi:hypothetical protein [Ammoniphilus sp. 3BR4]|uniref:hypothetical protein n=1 Tax=Ammoniphilus sp. 3BR4 TaxID=3158265 RepID=UPI003465B2A9